MESAINPNLLPMYFALAIVIPVGIYVFLVNPRRVANQIFLMLTTEYLFWGLCFGNILTAKTDVEALFWFRLTNFSSVALHVIMNLLRLAIVEEPARLSKIVGQSRWLFAAAIFTGLLTLTPWFATGMELSASHVPAAQYAGGVVFFGAYMVIGAVVVFWPYARDIKRTQGLRRLELQYILLASVLCFPLGLGLTTGLQLVNPESDGIIYSPLTMLPLHVMMAYGIAAKSLMGVADVLRRILAYGLLGVYLVLVFALVAWVWPHLPGPVEIFSQEAGYLLASLIVVLSVAPASGYFRRFSHALFLHVETVDAHAALREFYRQARSASTTEALLTNFGTFLGATFGTDRVYILTPDAEETKFYEVYPLRGDAALLELPADHVLIQQIRRSSAPLARDMLHRRGSIENQRLRAALRKLDVSVASAAVSAAGKVRAITFLGSRLSGKVYGAIELEILQSLSSALALALEKAVLFAQVENARLYNDILLENLLSAVIAADVQERITLFNREAARLLGLSASDVIQQPLATLPQPVADALRQTMASRLRADSGTLSLPQGDSLPLYTRTSRSFLESSTGGPIGALLVLEDETDVRRLEMTLRRSSRLSRLGFLATLMARKIEEPLKVIKTSLLALPDNFENAAFRQQFVKTVSAEVTRIDSSVRDLLRFARSREPMFQHLSLRSLVEKSLHEFSRSTAGQQAQVTQQLTEALDEVRTDPEMLQQVLERILKRALEIAGESPQIALSSRHAATSATNVVEGQELLALEVSVPCASSVAARNFESADLGVEIAKEVVVDLGGSLEVNEREGEYLLLLPVSPGDKQVDCDRFESREIVPGGSGA